MLICSSGIKRWEKAKESRHIYKESEEADNRVVWRLFMTSKTKNLKIAAKKKHDLMRKDQRKPLSGRNLRLMHEMKAVATLFDELMAMEEKPKKIRIRLGAMNADPKAFKILFKEFAISMGYPDMDVEIDHIPVFAECTACGFKGSIPLVEHVHFVRCPDCKKVADIIKGNELELIE